VTARRILLRMVRPGEGLEITSSRIRLEDLYRSGEDPGRVDRVLAKLIDTRLVRLTEGETWEDRQVEVAHEALVRNWPTLVDWLEQEKVALAIRRRLEGRAAEWVRLGQGSGGLLDEVELREPERWLGSAEAAYLGNEPALLTLVEASKRAITIQTRNRSRLRLAFIAVLLMAAVLGVGLAIYAFGQRNLALIAQAQVHEQLSIVQIAFAAQEYARDEPELALLLAYEASARAPNPVTEQTLRNTLDQAIVSVKLIGHTDFVASARFSPDGRRMVTASYDQTARLWDVNGQPLATLQGHTGPVTSAVFNPDGQRIVTASDDTTARIWDVGGQLLATLQGHPRPLTSARFSPDGQRILTASDDATARIWDLSGQLLVTLKGHTGPINSVAFSFDGKYILTASEDTSTRLWASSGQLLATLQGHSEEVFSAVFSPDGTRILTASADSTVRQYLVNVDDLLKVAACRVGRGLTAEEIQRFQVPTPLKFDFAKRQCPPALGN
jgi:hypothetical protein